MPFPLQISRKGFKKMKQNSSLIARKYATGMFVFAKNNNCIDKIESAADIFSKLLNPVAVKFFSQPMVPAAEKKLILQEIFLKSGIDSSFSNAINVVVDNGRASILPQIITELKLLLNKFLGVQEIILETPSALSQQEENDIAHEVSKLLKKKVILVSRENKNLLSGMVLRIGNNLVDASLAARIKAIKELLSEKF
jgi:F-type H+-transporting ATPase subunit delta